MIDKYGLEFTSNTDCNEEVNLATDLLFNKKAGLDLVLPKESDNHPTCIMLAFYSALMCVFSSSQKIIEKQIPIFLERSQLNSANFNRREQLYYDAINCLLNIDFKQAFTYFEEILKLYPKDKVALLMIETTGFIGGIFPKIEVVYNQIGHLYLNEPNYLGMKAFLYSHLDKMKEAQEIVLKALEMDPRNAWLEHVYIHTLDITNSPAIDTTISFLEKNSFNWPNESRFFEGHNWMHIALLYMKQNKNSDLIFEKYNQHIWGAAKEFNFEQNNAFLTLWHAELNGIHVNNNYWQDLAHYSISYTDDYYTPYLTITSILAVAKSDLNKALDSVTKFEQYVNYLQKNNSNNYNSWNTGLGLLKGCISYINNDYAHAISYLEPLIEKSYIIGHSDEQRSIFPETLKKMKSTNSY